MPFYTKIVAEATRPGHSTWQRWTGKKLPTPPLSPTRPLQPFNCVTPIIKPFTTSSTMLSTMEENKGQPANSWLGHRGAAAFDFRSELTFHPFHFSLLSPCPFPPFCPPLSCLIYLSRTCSIIGDTMTTPTQDMLSAIQNTTLLDDVFKEDPTTMDLEAHVASLTGKEAALFVLSGTMGNQIALRSLLTQPPHGVLADHRAHIIRYESGG